jgi:hypothetical protein
MSIADSSGPASSPRFGLKSVFAFLTAAAVLLTPTYWFGGAYLVNAIFSAGLVVACIATYGLDRRPAAFAVAIIGAVMGFPLAIFLLAFFAHAVFNAILCIPLAIVRPPRTMFSAAVVGLMVVVYGFIFAEGAAELRRLQAIKLQYPLKSLASRLEFEKQRRQRNDGPRPALQLAANVALQLDDQDDRQDMFRYRRAWALRELHENTYRHFEQAAGFGVSRMPSLRYIDFEWEPRSPLNIPYAVNITSPKDGAELYGVHRTAVDKFVDPDWTGYVRSVNEVAGFEPHGLQAMPERGSCDSEPIAKWQVVRLELVSLLRHDEPRVYVAETMPAMDQLAGVPHRALNDFEASALAQLETQKDIVVGDETNRLLMLGAVRAGKTCLECHDGPRGTLLGAFSYEITQIQLDNKSKGKSRAAMLSAR